MVSFVSRLIAERKAKRDKKREKVVALAVLQGMTAQPLTDLQQAYNRTEMVSGVRRNAKLYAVMTYPVGVVLYGKNEYALATQWLRHMKQGLKYDGEIK